MFCYFDYSNNKGKRNSIRGLVATLVVKILTYSYKTQRTIPFSITEDEYVALLVYVQEVKFVNMLLEEIYEVQKPEIIYKYNQGAILLENNKQVGMRTKHINIRHHFLRCVVE